MEHDSRHGEWQIRFQDVLILVLMEIAAGYCGYRIGIWIVLILVLMEIAAGY